MVGGLVYFLPSKGYCHAPIKSWSLFVFKKNISWLLYFFLLFIYIFGKNPSNPLAAKASEIEYKLVKNFNFKDFNSDLRMMYRNNGHSEYFLSITTDNIPAYHFKKDRLVAYDVQELHINDCYISITNGDIQKYNNEYVTRNCEKYSIHDDIDDIFIKYKYETPLNYALLYVKTAQSGYSIPVYNTIVFDKENKLNSYLWNFDSKYNRIKDDRIVFLEPTKREHNLLTFKKNISRNFTAHLGIENGDESKYSNIYLVLNEDVSLDIGAQSYKKIVISSPLYKGQPIPIDREVLKGYFELTVRKSERDLELEFINPNFRSGQTVHIKVNGLFPPRTWSTFSIGNTKRTKPYELQSLTLISRKDD